MWTCSRCGSPNGTGVPRCYVCGSPPGYVAPAAPVHSAAPGGWANPRAHHQQAGFGGQVGAAPQAPPAAPRKKKSAAGCGIAGCLGVAAVLVAGLLGLLMFANASVSFIGFGDDDDRSAASDDDDGDDDDDDDRDKKRKPRGALRDNIPKKVGKLEVSSVKPVEVDGAVDSLVAVYEANGVRVEHALAVFPSEDDAQAALLAAARRANAKTRVEGKTRKIKDDDESETGIASHFRADPEILVYRIDKLMAVVYGPPGEVIPFFEKLPY